MTVEPNCSVQVGLLLLSPLDCFYCDLVPSNENRSSLITSLINAYNLHKLPNVQLINYRKCNKQDLVKFHDKSFVDFLMKERKYIDDELDHEKFKSLMELAKFSKKLTNSKTSAVDGEEEEKEEEDNEEEEEENSDYSFDEDQNESAAENLDKLKELGLIYDCSIFPYMNKYVEIIGGSTLSACDWLIRKYKLERIKSRIISINWFGGRHHAQKTKASGFCYINDIVLGILRLRSVFDKIMYIDFDLHHGDGVSNAFKMSNKVLTFSIHRFDVGFFPGTGDLEKDRGIGKGFNYDVNLPMRAGLSNKNLLKIINEILIPLIIYKFKPECLVIQCGCDGLNTDEHQQWNLTIKGMAFAINKILSTTEMPVLLLGGGGYNHTEVAKCWTYLTAIASNFQTEKDDDDDDDYDKWDLIPEHSHLDCYEGDGYEFWKNEREKRMKDQNEEDGWLDYLKKEILKRDIK